MLSPGPCTPNEAGICLDLIDRPARHHSRCSGVCLGIRRSARPMAARSSARQAQMHGKLSSQLRHTGKGVFGRAAGFEATRYHSLIVEREDPAGLPRDHGRTEDGIIMGLQHKTAVHGVQFHPESIASEHGHALLANFLELARAR